MKIAGLDIGTTGCKLTVFDEEGKYTDKAYRDYPVHRGSVHEIDAGRIADAVFAVIGEMAAKYHDIAWIGITSFGETAVLVDDSGEVLLPSMLYTDPRGKEECEKTYPEVRCGGRGPGRAQDRPDHGTSPARNVQSPQTHVDT